MAEQFNVFSNVLVPSAKQDIQLILRRVRVGRVEVVKGVVTFHPAIPNLAKHFLVHLYRSTYRHVTQDWARTCPSEYIVRHKNNVVAISPTPGLVLKPGERIVIGQNPLTRHVLTYAQCEISEEYDTMRLSGKGSVRVYFWSECEEEKEGEKTVRYYWGRDARDVWANTGWEDEMLLTNTDMADSVRAFLNVESSLITVGGLREVVRVWNRVLCKLGASEHRFFLQTPAGAVSRGNLKINIERSHSQALGSKAFSAVVLGAYKSFQHLHDIEVTPSSTFEFQLQMVEDRTNADTAEHHLYVHVSICQNYVPDYSRNVQRFFVPRSQVSEPLRFQYDIPALGVDQEDIDRAVLAVTLYGFSREDTLETDTTRVQRLAPNDPTSRCFVVGQGFMPLDWLPAPGRSVKLRVVDKCDRDYTRENGGSMLTRCEYRLSCLSRTMSGDPPRVSASMWWTGVRLKDGKWVDPLLFHDYWDDADTVCQELLDRHTHFVINVSTPSVPPRHIQTEHFNRYHVLRYSPITVYQMPAAFYSILESTESFDVNFYTNLIRVGCSMTGIALTKFVQVLEKQFAPETVTVVEGFWECVAAASRALSVCSLTTKYVFDRAYRFDLQTRAFTKVEVDRLYDVGETHAGDCEKVSQQIARIALTLCFKGKEKEEPRELVLFRRLVNLYSVTLVTGQVLNPYFSPTADEPPEFPITRDQSVCHLYCTLIPRAHMQHMLTYRDVSALSGMTIEDPTIGVVHPFYSIGPVREWEGQLMPLILEGTGDVFPIWRPLKEYYGAGTEAVLAREARKEERRQEAVKKHKDLADWAAMDAFGGRRRAFAGRYPVLESLQVQELWSSFYLRPTDLWMPSVFKNQQLYYESQGVDVKDRVYSLNAAICYKETMRYGVTFFDWACRPETIALQGSLLFSGEEWDTISAVLDNEHPVQTYRLSKVVEYETQDPETVSFYASTRDAATLAPDLPVIRRKLTDTESFVEVRLS